MMIALALLWIVLFAAWRWEFGRCTILPRWKVAGITITERAQMVALLAPLSIPAGHALGWKFALVMWAVTALYWTRGHDWTRWHKLLYRYGPPGLIYRAAFAWWPERWNDGKYIDGPESAARIGVGACCGLLVGALWLA